MTTTRCGCSTITASHDGKNTIEFCPLHAAAEDLLEAVREILALWSRHGLGNNHTEFEQVYTLLRSAFAKAMGGESQRGKGPTRQTSTSRSIP